MFRLLSGYSSAFLFQNYMVTMMGVENNYVVIATTWDSKSMAKVRKWVSNLSPELRILFSFKKSIVNNTQTCFLAPSGSKAGWPDAQGHDELRKKLIEILKSFDYSDGSNPFKFVEIGYGELGQQILQGNCRNCYV